MKAQGRGLRDIAADLRLPVDELHRLVFELVRPNPLDLGSKSEVAFLNA